MEETISLRDLFETLRKRLTLILLLTFTATAVSAIISFFVITPVYQVTTQLLVNRTQVGENFNTNEVQTSIQLINTYSGIITSPAILNIVIDELDLDLTVEELKGIISVQSENNSQIMNVSVEDADPEQATLIANKIADVFQREVPNSMNVDNVSILTPAEVTEEISPVKPKPLLNIAIALVVGLMAGVGLAFLLEYLDNTVKTEQDIERYLDIPVLGVITTFGEEALDPTLAHHTRTTRGGKRLNG